MLILRNAIISVMILSFVHAAAFFQPQHRAYQRIKSMELFPVCGSESIFSRVKDDANNRWNSFAGFRSSICRGKSRVDGEDSTSAPNKENESSSSAPMFDRHGDNSQYIADSNATRAVDDQFSLHGVSNHSSKSGSNNTIKPAVELSDYMLKLLSEVTEGDANGEKTAPVIESELPIIAIIGRPNTGKSTLVNKITSTYHEGAIVSDEAGITRDRTYRVADWEGYNFQVVDTGGIIFDDKEGLFAEQITQQALQALQEAKVAVMVVDGQIGLHPMDEELARWYRRNALKRVPVYVAVNKCESHTQGLQQVPPFYKLGLGEPLPVSGIHGNGVGELLDKVVKHIDKVDTPLKENSTNVAFIGRPNVGKSSLFNKLLGKQRAIVSDIPGTTRDSLDAVIYRGGGGGKGESTGKGKKNSKSGSRSYRIIDTAGIRRKGKIEYGSEFYMVNRAFKAIKRADVVVLLIDATRGVVDQDRILAERIEQEGRACVICMNKWDLVEDKDDSSFIKATAHIRDNLPLLKWAEIVVTSAVTGQRSERLIEAIDTAFANHHRKMSSTALNEAVNDAIMFQNPPKIGARTGRVYYCMQGGTAPPTVVLFTNNGKMFPDGYRRYIERKLRDSLELTGTPLRLVWRDKSLREVTRAGGDAVVAPPSLSSGSGIVRKQT